LEYSIKRLIRGNGSPNQASRIGFHTAFAGLLNSEFKNPLDIGDMIEIIKKEFLGNDDKGKVDSLVGTALSCGCIIRSEKIFERIQDEEIGEITKCLVVCLSKPSVSSLAYNFLNDLITKVR
jgi:DNA polymerase phi